MNGLIRNFSVAALALAFVAGGAVDLAGGMSTYEPWVSLRAALRGLIRALTRASGMPRRIASTSTMAASLPSRLSLP